MKTTHEWLKIVFVQMLLWNSSVDSFSLLQNNMRYDVERISKPLYATIETEDFSSLTVPALKSRLRSAGLPVSGNKAELTERLQKAFELNKEEELEPEPSLELQVLVPPEQNMQELTDGVEEKLTRGPSQTSDAPSEENILQKQPVLADLEEPKNLLEELESTSERQTVEEIPENEGAFQTVDDTEEVEIDNQRPPILFFDSQECELDEDEVHDMMAARAELRAARDFKAADSMLEELEEHGILVCDLPAINSYELLYLNPRVTKTMLRARLRAGGVKAGGTKVQMYKRLVEEDLDADWDAPAATSYVPMHLLDPELDYTPTESFVDFDKQFTGRVIGRRGKSIAEMEENSSCTLSVIQEDDYPNARILVEGPAHAVPKAIQMIHGAVENAKASAKRAEREFERKRGRIEPRNEREQQKEKPQIVDGTRIFVHNLPIDCTYQDLRDHFSQAGDVAFARLSTDRDGKSKGCGVVQFKAKEMAERAILMLNEQEFRGRRLGVREDVDFDTRKVKPVRSKRSDDFAEKNYGGSPGRMDDAERKACRVFVSGLPFKATWEDLKDHFKENFHEGNVVYTKVHEGRDGRSKGCGVVQFETVDQKDAAIQAMNDSDFWGRQIFVREDVDDRKKGREDSQWGRNQRSGGRSTRNSGSRPSRITKGRSNEDFDVADGSWLEDKEDAFYY